jgi:hypothetical protein
MRTVRGVLTALTLMLGPTACAVIAEDPVPAPDVSTQSQSIPSPPASTSAPPTPSTTSRADAIRDWEALAGDHFKQSAAALQKVSEASAAEDEAGLRSGCQQLHDANSIGLQDDLPTPNRELTSQLQQMIDDMNIATHACLRFALARNPADADTYQEYLSRAVEHLQSAKVILNALKK